ncbi:MAG: aminotransferase class V-fold PLP-dependent enzyme [Clostridia bacterium]|nr:aminotransferase class V-fold PLP-dependent enzyme [Clostridia bacterium]
MIYFDNAATTFPKPTSVINEMITCMTTYCGNPGRSGHFLSVKAAEKIYDCRELISRTFGITNATNVIFTPNTTTSLNIAIRAFAKKRSHIIISDIEHNSVYRTVASLAKQGIDFDIFKVDPYDNGNTVRNLRSKIRSNTSMVVCNHVSNVCGIVLPLFEIGQLCKRFGLSFIVDGAQSVGTHRIDVTGFNIDALCCPGHKGLYGPQGTGFIVLADKYAKESLVSHLSPFVTGGNGVNSAERKMPDILPEKFEGGTLNTPGIAGLYEGIKFVEQKNPDSIFRHVAGLYRTAADMVSSLPNTTVYYKDLPQSSCLLFNVNGIDSDAVSDRLNDFGICVRGGLHCSPLIHKKLGLEKGAVRASFSCFNTRSELDLFYNALKSITFIG